MISLRFATMAMIFFVIGDLLLPLMRHRHLLVVDGFVQVHAESLVWYYLGHLVHEW